MITNEEMKWLLNWPAVSKNRVLSIYLNMEPSGEAILRRRFENAFKLQVQALEREVPENRREDFESDVDLARQFIAGFRPDGQGLVIYADQSENFLWTKELHIPIADQAYWDEKPHILPLLEAFDEYERYGVILVDKKRARVFTYALGEIEDEEGAINSNAVRRFKTAGKDNLRSAFKLQRTNELHEEWHLKHAAEMMAGIAERRHFDRLILGGSKKAADQLFESLPQNLQTKVMGRLPVHIEEQDRNMLEALTELEKQIERGTEEKIVEDLLRSDRTDNHKVLGLEGVLTHLNRGLVHTLIYSENFKASGCRCTGCGYLYPQERLMCGRCGGLIERLPHFLEEMARRAVINGGNIEEVRESAARKLDDVAGGAGAILKKQPE